MSLERANTIVLKEDEPLVPKLGSTMSMQQLYRTATGYNEWGMPYYIPPKSGVPKDQTRYKIGKQKRNTFIDQIKSASKETPSPAKYDLRKQLSAPQGKFKKCARNTNLDMLVLREKRKPGPASYKSSSVTKIRGGKQDKANNNYMNDIVFQAKSKPAASHYSPQPNTIRKRSEAWKWTNPPKMIKTLKAQVGPGSYKPELGQRFSLKRPTSCAFSRSKERDIFNLRSARGVPGVGAYNLDQELKIWKGPKTTRR